MKTKDLFLDAYVCMLRVENDEVIHTDGYKNTLANLLKQVSKEGNVERVNKLCENAAKFQNLMDKKKLST